jgi:mono/diheme cytochrome c family protein
MRIRNWKIRVGSRLVLGLAVGCAILAGSGAKSQAPDSEKQFQTLIRSVRGPDLFRAYCASCHGADAKGNGPAAAALKTKVPDLTILSKNNGGEFPSARVRKMIMGDDVVASHGSREMPIWGPVFHQIEWDVDRGYLRLENLVKYLESIQTLQKK